MNIHRRVDDDSTVIVYVRILVGWVYVGILVGRSWWVNNKSTAHVNTYLLKTRKRKLTLEKHVPVLLKEGLESYGNISFVWFWSVLQYFPATLQIVTGIAVSTETDTQLLPMINIHNL